MSDSGLWMWRDIQFININSSYQRSDWDDHHDNGYNRRWRKYVQIDVLFQKSF